MSGRGLRSWLAASDRLGRSVGPDDHEALQVMDYESAFRAVLANERYQRNLDWGEPRPGHPEGTVRAHIAEIEPNIDALAPKLSDIDRWKLRLLVHTHDLFKAESRPGVAITDPASHASLARSFLAEFCPDEELLAMVQYHDEPFALWRQAQSKGRCNQRRMDALIDNISDWKLFLAFNIIDGCTDGKSREPLRWLFKELNGRVDSTFTEADIISQSNAGTR